MTAHARVLHSRRWVFDTIEGGTPLVRAQVFNQLIIWLILVNVLVVILESVPSMHAEFGWYFLQFERLSLVIFGIEYLCRLWVAVEYPYVRQRGPWGGRLMFALRPSMLIDLLAIMPMVLAMLVPGIDSLILRLIRLLRFLKLARFSPAMTTVWDAIYGERRALAGAFVLMVGTAIFSGAVMHAVERAAQPDKFGTIPDGIWWALATLTTIGYGDVVPVTPLGKVLGGLVMICGLALFSLPIGIIATAFVNEIHRRDFVITWGMVARVPLFAGLDVSGVAEITKILRTRQVEPGDVITQAGALADGLYIIGSGEVRVDLSPQDITLRAGDFFGEIALLKRVRRHVTTTAVTHCKLMVIETADFAQLMQDDPTLRARIVEAADARLQGEWADAGTDMSSQELEARASNEVSEAQST